MIAEICFIAGLAALAVKWNATDHTDSTEALDSPVETTTAVDIADIRQRIEGLQRTADRLSQLDSLLTDLEIAAPDVREMPVSIQWHTATTGDSQRAEIWTDGRSSTAALRSAVSEEMCTVTTSLLTQISDLYCNAVYKTSTKRQENQQGRG